MAPSGSGWRQAGAQAFFFANWPRPWCTVNFPTAINLLKVDASKLAVETVNDAMLAGGLSGYRNDGMPASAASLLDSFSAPAIT